MGVLVTVIQNDNSVPWDFTVVDINANAVDLTNTSNNLFKMRAPGSMVDAVNSSTTIQSATGGVIRYTFQKADLANSNVSGYQAEIELYYKAGNASGRNVTVGGILVQILPEAPE